MSVPDPPLPDVSGLRVALLGGTGEQGRGLGRRLAMAGHPVVIGSRDAGRAAAAAAELSTSAPGGTITGLANADAAAAAEVVIAAVPWEGHGDLLASLAGVLRGRILIDCVNPLGFDKQGAYALPVAEGSAAQQAAALLPESRVVAAFHHVPAPLLLDPAVGAIDCDVMVLGDDREATDIVIALAGRIAGMRGVYAGRLRGAGQVEALTANVIAVNRRYKTHAGVRVTGV